MRFRTFGILSLLLALSIAAWGVTPQFWENFSQEDLLKGTLTRVSLSADGKLFLAPGYNLLYDTQQPYIFSMVRDKSGNLYAGTGHEGKVYKIDSQGNGDVYFQSKELDVFALALDSADTLYVGTSPDGKVYKVSAANQLTEYCNPEDKYIWSMSFDEAGNLYIGTGGRGLIVKVDKSGKKSTFYDSDDTHIVSLVRDGGGSILAGTSPGGLILQISPQGKAFTLLDSTLEEIRSLAIDRFGTIFAVGSSSKGLPAATPVKTESPTESVTGVLPLATIQALSNLADRGKDARSTVTAPGGEKDSTGSRSAVYSIMKDGSAETVYNSRDQMIYDIVVRADGSILAASGVKGRLLSIDSAKQVTVVTDSPDEQTTRLVQAGDEVFVAGSNQGKVYRLQTQRSATGTYESRVFDAKTVASWGKISWQAASSSGGTVELATRTGNTDKPDSTWSDWSQAYTLSAGQQIASPNARFMQWRATFKRGANPQSLDSLDNLRIAYLQQNLRPQVTSITPLAPGVALQKTPSIPTGTLNVTSSGGDGSPVTSPRERSKERQPLPPRQVLQPGAQAFNWRATDDNEDTLEYSLYFKGEGESDWKLLEKKLTDTFYTLEAGSLPDGIYTFKVVASDAPSNPFGKFLIGEMVSKPFIISNSTPQIEIAGHKIAGKRVELQFRAKVTTGRISSAEFSVDGGEWYLVFPNDGIADSLMEEFAVTTPELTTGEHTIGLRAADTNGTTGTGKLVVRIP